ncbi:MAG: putative membrane protein [Flavobacteriales bacterium]|jgi:uncharacterized membrane protein
MEETSGILYLVIIFDGLFFLALAYYYLKRPPKKINEMYGYRTRKTMANQDIWDAANKRNAEDLVKYSWVLLLTGVLLWIFQISYAMIIHLIILLIGLAVAMYSTMRYLNEHFDINSNKKQ